MQDKRGNYESTALASEQDEEEKSVFEEKSDDDDNHPVQENVEGDGTQLTGRQKKLFELRLKMVFLF